jgi:hypothetical protein
MRRGSRGKLNSVDAGEKGREWPCKLRNPRVLIQHYSYRASQLWGDAITDVSDESGVKRAMLQGTDNRIEDDHLSTLSGMSEHHIVRS